MRKRRAEKRFVKPDPKYNEVIVTKFVNYMMLDGKKSTSRTLIYDALDLVEKKTKKTSNGSFQKGDF